MSDWIKPGAAIAVYQCGRDGSHGLKLTTVDRVAGQSFTTVSPAERFKLSTFETKRFGSTWDRWYFAATHPDSATAARVAAADKRARMRTSVWPYLNNGCESLEEVDRAIRELTEWRALLASEDQS